MAVQGTGAMAVIIADIPEVHTAVDPALALDTLAVVTGVIMLVAGLLRLGSIMRFVSNAVMVGFINAVRVNSSCSGSCCCSRSGSSCSAP